MKLMGNEMVNDMMRLVGAGGGAGKEEETSDFCSREKFYSQVIYGQTQFLVLLFRVRGDSGFGFRPGLGLGSGF